MNVALSTLRPPRPSRWLTALLLVAALSGAATELHAQGGRSGHQEPQEGASVNPDTSAEDPAESQGRPISLPAALQRAVENNPLTRAGRLDVRRRQLDVEQLENFWATSSFQFSSLSGIVPAARGDIFFSPDTSRDLNDLGPFYRFEFNALVPVYTFGRLRHAAAAARGAVNAEQGRADRTRDELTMQVVQAYWGLVAARKSLDLAQDMSSSYEELLEKIDEKMEAGDIDPNDAWEAKAARFDIDAARLSVVESHAVLQGALAEMLGEDPSSTIYEPVEEGPPEVGLAREDLTRLQALARRIHPGLRALGAAVGALEEGMAVARAGRWPIFLVGGTFGMAQSPNRDEQTNPFVYDEFNYRRIGAAFSIQWDLNFARHRIDYTKRMIERDATDARSQALAMQVSIEVRQALERVLKNVQLVESARETRRTTRRWLRTAFDDFDLGIGEAQPLIKAYRADYRLQGLIIETQYELNLSLAQLSFALGDFHTYVRWITDGRVALD
jgi:outer membrane protein TolC